MNQQNGPVFESEPGWGGQLKTWLSANFTRYILPVIVIVVVAYVIVSVSGKDTVADNTKSPSPTVSPSSQPTGIAVTVIAKDNYTLVARRAINEYDNILSAPLTKGMRLYLETELQKTLHDQPLQTGGTINVSRGNIAELLDAYAKLTATQRAKWEAMAKNVKF